MAADRRCVPRRRPSSEEPLSTLRLRTGRELSVVDISDAGALVEGTTRLLPGTHVEVHIVTREGRTLVRSRVTRASVHTLTADTLRYRAALSFDQRVNTSAARVVTTHFAPLGAAPGSVYPNSEASKHSAEEEGAC
jgi:hypothetical protein